MEKKEILFELLGFKNYSGEETKMILDTIRIRDEDLDRLLSEGEFIKKELDDSIQDRLSAAFFVDSLCDDALSCLTTAFEDEVLQEALGYFVDDAIVRSITAKSFANIGVLLMTMNFMKRFEDFYDSDEDCMKLKPAEFNKEFFIHQALIRSIHDIHGSDRSDLYARFLTSLGFRSDAVSEDARFFYEILMRDVGKSMQKFLGKISKTRDLSEFSMPVFRFLMIKMAYETIFSAEYSHLLNALSLPSFRADLKIEVDEAFDIIVLPFLLEIIREQKKSVQS